MRWQPTTIIAGVAALLGILYISRRKSLDFDDPYREPSDTPVDPVDAYAERDLAPPGHRDLTEKPGAKAFRQWAIDRWGERAGSPRNIVADKDGEHGEGRAWDLMTLSKEHGQAIVDELLAPDPVTGEPHALARRAGIMYMIWDKRMWRAYEHAGAPRGSWGPYSGPNPHTDHIHFSFSWAGANAETSLYKQIGVA